MRFEHLLLPAFALLVFACGGNSSSAEEVAAADSAQTEPANTEEATDNWITLFDGSNLDMWHKYGMDDVGEAWTITEEGYLMLDNSNKDENGKIINGGDIVTDESYANYELELEWKIGPCGNSGIIYNVIESEDYPYPWLTGPEMQVLDNSCHPDAKIYKHRAADLYDMIAADSTAVKPAGEWNQVKLVVTDNKVEHWINGQQVVTYVPTGDSWKEMIANSKFAEFEGFGSVTRGHIALQDHDDLVYYRNIRIREL